MVPVKRFYFSPFYSLFYFFFVSIPNVQFIPQFIYVIATNKDLLTDELNVIYFALILWLYVVIWLPRTTDNSTYIAQSLENRGIESRLYGIFQNINVSSANELITIRLFCHLSCDYFREEFATVLRNNSHTELYSIQKKYLNTSLVIPFTSLTLFRAVLSAGANVNFLDDFKRTLLTILKDYYRDHIDVMDKIKLLINENPDHETHKTAVMRGLWRDSAALQKYDKTVVKHGNYIVDAKQHGRYGYDDDDNFCLNFMGPFLMECGFPVSRQSLIDSLNGDLHPSVRAYILKYIKSPMPLKVICRDTLRRHFKGRLIHRFAEQSQCPRAIKNFLLLNSLLSRKGCVSQIFSQTRKYLLISSETIRR